jgi:hypothetical protein
MTYFLCSNNKFELHQKTGSMVAGVGGEGTVLQSVCSQTDTITTRWTCGEWAASFLRLSASFPSFQVLFSLYCLCHVHPHSVRWQICKSLCWPMCWQWCQNAAGNNELDQVQKIHKILGTPPMQLLEKMKRQASQLGALFLLSVSCCSQAYMHAWSCCTSFREETNSHLTVTEVVNLSVPLLFPCLVCITWFCYHEPHSSLHYAKNECTNNVRLKWGKKCAQEVSTCGFQIPTSGRDRNRTTHPTCFSSMCGVAQQVACIQSWWPVGTLFVYYVYVHNGCSELQKPFKNWEIVRHWILTNKFLMNTWNIWFGFGCVCFWGAPLGCQPGKHSDMVTSKICETRRSFNKHLLVQIVAMVFDLLLGSFLPPLPAPLLQNCYSLASSSLN